MVVAEWGRAEAEQEQARARPTRRTEDDAFQQCQHVHGISLPNLVHATINTETQATGQDFPSEFNSIDEGNVLAPSSPEPRMQ